MKKTILVLTAALLAISASAQKNSISLQGSVGTSSIYGDSFKPIKASWKVGVGYEFRASKHIGIEPLVFFGSRGYTSNGEEMGLTYVDVPLMLNIYIGPGCAWEIDAGLYYSYLLKGNDKVDAKKSDAGLRVDARYNFSNKLFVGLDVMHGITEVLPNKHNVTLGVLAGIRF